MRSRSRSLSRYHSRFAPLACLPIALAALAGCGGSSSSGNGVASKSPTDIVSAAKTAADGASSVHVTGSIVNAGSTIALDMELLKGTGGHGKLSQNGLSFELVEVGDSVYIKGSPAFYQHFAGGAAAQLLQGKWLKAPANTGNFATLGSLTDLRKLLDSTLASHGTLAKGATTKVEGQEAIGVKDLSRGGTLYVATSGTSYPLQITKGGSGGGTVTFNHWNAPVTVTAPTNAVDLSKLASGH